MAEYTYVLYLTIDHEGQHDNEIIFLGSSAELHSLYYKAVSIQYKVKPEDVGILSVQRKIIAEWKELVKAELDICQEEELDSAFMKGDNYSYTLKHMTLHLEKVQSFDSQFSDKQTQPTKQVEKNINNIKKFVANEHNKICEIPNYARIIEDHKKNHLEYYKELQSMRATELD